MTQPLRQTLSGELPPLPEYRADPEDPQKVAAPCTPELADLYADASGGGDGYPFAFAALRNGYRRVEVGAMWGEMRIGHHPDAISPAARAHFDAHLDLATSGVAVRRSDSGQDPLDYGRHVLHDVLRRPARLVDTDVRLRTPYDYYVPGTRFDDAFPADNVQVIFGLLADGYIRSAAETHAVTAHNTMRFGYDPNLSKVGMLRQQTPLDSFALEALQGLYGNEVLQHFLPALERNLAFMQEGRERVRHIGRGERTAYRRIGHLIGGGGKPLRVFRNWDDTPVDYEGRSVIRIESAAKDRETGERAICGIRDRDERAHQWVKTQVSLAAGAESFQDMSDYQLKDRKNLHTTRTTEIYTSWMQAAVANKARLAALAHEARGDFLEAEKHWKLFNELKEVVGLMWRQTGENRGHYTDLLLDGTQTGALNAAQLLPLLVPGFVPHEQAVMTVNEFRATLLGQNGLKTSDILDCDEQWTGPRDWPSLAALAKHASMQQAHEARLNGNDPGPFIAFAEEVDYVMNRGIEAWHGEHGTFAERISDEAPTEVAAGGEYCNVGPNGEKPKPQIGFGMTIGAYIVAKTLNLRKVFENMDPRGGTWLGQSFAVHLGRSALLVSGRRA